MNKLPLDHFLSYKYVSNLATSPNRKRLAFMANCADLKKNDYLGILYIVEKGKTKRLIRLKDAGSFIFETDDTILIPFTKNKKEEKLKKQQKTIYYRYDFVTKKVTLAYIFQAPLSIVKVLSDGRLLLNGALSNDEMALLTIKEDKRKAFIDALKKQKAFVDIDQIPFYFNGKGFIANKQSRLFIYDPKKPSYKQISGENVHVDGFSASKDVIYFHGYTLADVMPLHNDIYLYDLKSNQTTKVYDNKGKYMLSTIEVVEDKLIVLATDGKTYGLNQDPDFFMLKDNELSLVGQFGYSVGNTIGSDVRYGGNPQHFVHDGELYFIETVDDHTVINKLDLDGSIIHVLDMHGAIDGIAYFEDEVYLVGLYRQMLQEV